MSEAKTEAGVRTHLRPKDLAVGLLAAAIDHDHPERANERAKLAVEAILAAGHAATETGHTGEPCCSEARRLHNIVRGYDETWDAIDKELRTLELSARGPLRERVSRVLSELRERCDAQGPVDALAVANETLRMTCKTLNAGENESVQDAAARVVAELELSTKEVQHLRRLLNTPELHDFSKAVVLEALHQRIRWPSDHDEGKEAEAWMWLLGHLIGKAVRAISKDGDREKALHHVVTSAAVLANWHAAIEGRHTEMRPGIAAPAEGSS